MKILVAIPCMEQVHVQFVNSLIRLDKPDNSEINVRFLPGSLIYDSRNLLSQEAIRDGYDYILWLDSDMTFPPDIISRMLNDMNTTGTRMVTGLYVKRTYPTSPVLYDYIAPPEKTPNGFVKKIHDFVNYPQNSVFRVDGCGFGCVMTSVSLLKDVWDTYGLAFNPFPWASEDVSFCYRVRQMGEEILCDSSISCGHIGSFLFTEQMMNRGDTH